MWKNRGSKTFIKQDLVIKWGILSKSGSIWNSISFPSFYFVLGLKIVWPSQPDRCKTNINSNLVTSFPPLYSVSSFLYWVCIIFKWYFLLSWFAILITQILVSQHAFEQFHTSCAYPQSRFLAMMDTPSCDWCKSQSPFERLSSHSGGKWSFNSWT